jgi:hypothetical protein
MLQEFNACAKLVNEEDYSAFSLQYDGLLKEGIDPFKEMLKFQLKLQVDLNSKLPYLNPNPTELKTIGEKIDWQKKNFDAILDEFRELLTSMGGMSNGSKKASAAWKTWKSDHQKIRETEFESYSNEDRLEILFELIDIWHFMMNMFLGLNMSAKDIYILYMIKNKENLRRYASGY